jgi:hypothetical protein
MTADWRKLTRDAKLTVHGEAIELRLGDGRKHAVYVDDRSAGQLRLWSVVARAGVVRKVSQPNIRAWTRNRVTELVGFKLHEDGRLIGEAWVPLAGLGHAEWEFYVRSVGLACDRFEYVLTGQDTE